MTVNILNFGSLNIDHVYYVDDFVKPGETKLSYNLNKFGGGKGNNQSIALARAGATVHHAGAIGVDGSFLIDALQKEGVNTDLIKIHPSEATGHAIIQVNNQGENCILLHGGANQTITRSDIESILSNFNKGDILLIQNEISCIADIINLANKKEIVIYFNPAPMNAAVLQYPLENIDTFIVNQVEAAAFTKCHDTESILKKMLELFPNSKVILTLGKDGVIYQDKQQKIYQPAIAVETVDTTAAGDTFIGYFLAATQKNLDIKSSLELACRAASKAVTKQGATDSIPYIEELECNHNLQSVK